MRLLLVEDDHRLAEQMRLALLEAGYSLDQAFEGIEGLFLAETEPYDAIILDLGLPGLPGDGILKALRDKKNKTPVLILTARDSWSDKVTSLDAGADDYITKPFVMAELLARVRALIRRAAGQTSALLICGPLSLDTASSEVHVDGALVKLTAQEFKLLAYMMHHPGVLLSRTTLTEHIYAQDFDRDSNTIEVFITRIRKKTGLGLIETVRGLGYRLQCAERQGMPQAEALPQ